MGWSENVETIVKKAQQRLYFLRQLRKFGMDQKIMVQFYRAVIESVLTFSVTVWYGGATAEDKSRLNSVVKTASRVIGCELPSLEEIHSKRMLRRATNIAKDSAHPAQPLFSRLPSGRRLRHIKARTVRFWNSFFPAAVRALSTHPVPLPEHEGDS